MESIKEEELNRQREVVTTTPNTWLVEAVNPTTGEKKMINVSNFASVVAGVINPLVTNRVTSPSWDEIVSIGKSLPNGGSIYVTTNAWTDSGLDSSLVSAIISKASNGFRFTFTCVTTLQFREYNLVEDKWEKLKRTDNFGYNTLAELAAALKPLL